VAGVEQPRGDAAAHRAEAEHRDWLLVRRRLGKLFHGRDDTGATLICLMEVVRRLIG
jgi:hypothetical protein